MKSSKPAVAEIVTRFRTLKAQHAAGADAYSADDDIEHLRTALDGAITLEFATLPPYLSAIWTFKHDLHPVAKSLRNILQEEMLHMALACNLMVAIGGVVRINSNAPTYPGHLPLDVHPELTVPLAGFSPEVLKVFMEIERPKHPGHHLSLKSVRAMAHDALDDGKDLTIGEMYEHTLAAFRRLKPSLSVDHQITGPLAWMVVKHSDDVARAIELIMHQGEGSEGPLDTGPDNLAHYYRFAEMVEGRSLTLDPASGKYAFTTPIDLDYERDVWPIAPVPAGGYTGANVADAEVLRLVRQFNLTYSKLLDLLQAAWTMRGGQASFWHAIETMFALEQSAKPLMQMPRPDGLGNYAPDFRYIPAAER